MSRNPAGSAADRLEKAARAFRSIPKRRGMGFAKSTNRQGKGLPSAFSTNRQGKIRAGKLRPGTAEHTMLKARIASSGRVFKIRSYRTPAGMRVASPGGRVQAAASWNQVRVSTAKGRYYLLAPTGALVRAAHGKYGLEDGSILII